MKIILQNNSGQIVSEEEIDGIVAGLIVKKQVGDMD